MMLRRPGIVIALALTMATTAGTMAQSATPDGEIGATDLDVAGRVLSISPDGAWLFGEGPDREACLWSLPELDARCDDRVPGLDPEAIAWAPDSSAVAFSQQSARLMIDSDISVMTVDDGAVTPVTDVPDENQERISLDGEGVSVIDVQPRWADDGASITFIRSTFSETTRNTRLARVDLTSGEVEDTFVLSPTFFLASYAPLYHAADGGILVSMDTGKPGAASNGIWKVAADGSRIDRVTPAPADGEDGRYAIHAISDDASTAVVQDYGAWSEAVRDGSPLAWSILDLETGRIAPLLDTDDTQTVVYGHPVFIDGTTTVVSLVRVGDGPLAFATGAGEPEIVIELPDTGDRTATGFMTSETGAVVITWDDDSATLYTGAGEQGDDLDCVGDEDGCAPIPAPCGCTPPASRPGDRAGDRLPV